MSVVEDTLDKISNYYQKDDLKSLAKSLNIDVTGDKREMASILVNRLNVSYERFRSLMTELVFKNPTREKKEKTSNPMITFRVTEKEKETIKEKADKNNKSVSDFAKEMLLNGKVLVDDKNPKVQISSNDMNKSTNNKDVEFLVGELRFMIGFFQKNVKSGIKLNIDNDEKSRLKKILTKIKELSK